MTEEPKDMRGASAPYFVADDSGRSQFLDDVIASVGSFQVIRGQFEQMMMRANERPTVILVGPHMGAALAKMVGMGVMSIIEDDERIAFNLEPGGDLHNAALGAERCVVLKRQSGGQIAEDIFKYMKAEEQEAKAKFRPHDRFLPKAPRSARKAKR